MLTVIVVADEQESTICQGVTAGPDNSKTITKSEAAAIESRDEVKKMCLSSLAPSVSRNEVFDPSKWDLIDEFKARKTGEFSITYTITEGDCTDSIL